MRDVSTYIRDNLATKFFKTIFNTNVLNLENSNQLEYDIEF